MKSLEPYCESFDFRICPLSYRYNLGIHTINFYHNDEFAVIDVYGYFYPVLGGFYYSKVVRKILSLIKRKK